MIKIKRILLLRKNLKDMPLLTKTPSCHKKQEGVLDVERLALYAKTSPR